MIRPLSRAIKGIFRTLGFRLERIPPGNPYDFAPRPEDRDRWIRDLGIRTVLDVGAHDGESAMQFRAMLPEAMIYSFEPLRDCFARLESVVAGKDLHRVFNLALGSACGRSEIHRSEYSASSSLLPMADLHKSAYPFSAGSTSETIEVQTLDALAPSLGLQPPILMKIDTQGFEKQVLIGAEATLPGIKLLIVETSFGELYQGQPRFPEIYRMLEGAGFEYRGSWDQFLSPKDGTPLQQDAIFLRPGP
jgi:FkbM family methyltransferase